MVKMFWLVPDLSSSDLMNAVFYQSCHDATHLTYG